MRIVRTQEIALCRELHDRYLGEDCTFETPEAGNLYWLALHGDLPFGYCSMRPSVIDPYAIFLSRCVVTLGARGQGLQRRMIRVREREARRLDFWRCTTYTARDNMASAHNLIRCGYTLYRPTPPYAGDDELYFERHLG